MDAKVKTQSEVKSGKYVEPSDVTVKELFEAWLEAGKTRGVTRHGRWKIQSYYSHVAQLGHIAPKLGDIKASLLRKSTIEQAAAGWKEAISANTLIAQLAAAFKWALRDPDRFGVKANPVDIVERFAREERPEQIDEEFADYGEAQLRSKPGHGEICGLRWSQVNLKRRTLTVNRSLTRLSKKRGGTRLEAPKRKKRVLNRTPSTACCRTPRMKIAVPAQPARSRVRKLAREADLPTRAGR